MSCIQEILCFNCAVCVNMKYLQQQAYSAASRKLLETEARQAVINIKSIKLAQGKIKI